jgi:MoaA/NifB/PqqE/SkfB family radical SAM enzyme
MTDNIHEIEDLVKLAKELDIKISLAVAHEYCNSKATAPARNEIRELAGKLVGMRRNGYPLVNSVSYFKVIAKEKKWTCKPWLTVNVGPEGTLILPCYVRNEYATSAAVFETSIKTAISGLTGRKHRTAKTAISIVT